MAYDPSSQYVPPRRAYHDQQSQAPQQSAQYRNGYGGHGQEQNGNGYYAQQQPAQQEYGNGYDTGYGQGYDQNYNQGYGQDYSYDYGQGYDHSYGQDQGQWSGYQDPRRPPPGPRSPQYSQDQYNKPRKSKQQSSRQRDGYGQQEQQRPPRDKRRDDRQYDPRYQQRQEKTRPPNDYDQPRQERGRQPRYNTQPPIDDWNRDQRLDQRRQNMAPQQPDYDAQVRPQQFAQQPPQPSMPAQTHDSRPNPRNGRTYPGESQPQPIPTFAPRSSSRPAPVTSNSTPHTFDLPPPPRIHDHGRPMSAPSSGRAASPSKMTMAEWKAAERARMHADSAMPDTVAWDNAFPVFPTKRDRSKARSGTSSARASADLPRPATASSNRHERHSSKSRTYSDSASALQAGQQQQSSGRPILDRNAHSFTQAAELPLHNSPKSAMKAPMVQQYSARDSTTSPEYAGQPQQRPEPVVSQPVQNDRWQPAPQVNDSRQGFAEQQPQPSVDFGQSRQQSPPVTSNDVRSYERAPGSFQQEQRTDYLSHHPLSPAPLQPRPSTAHGQRSQATHSFVKLPISHSEIASARSRDIQAETSNSWGSNGTSNQNQSSSSQVVRTATPPRTRDQEIEDEMPDFDSAAPGGTSLLHKRSQAQLKEAPVDDAPPMPAVVPVQVDSTPIPVSPQDQRSYAPQPTQAEVPFVDPGRSDMSQATTANGGFVYGQPGQNTSRKFGASYGTSPPPPQQTQQQYQQPPPQPRQQQFQHPPPQQQFQQPPPQQQFQQPPPQQQFQQPPPQQQFQRPPPQHFQQDIQQQYPPRPPFAEERPRRSMDDARQMPYRQAPPAHQRPNMSGPLPPRQQYPPPSQSRGPGRNVPDLSVQTSWAGDYRQNTVNSAPPTQQSFRDFYPPQGTDGGAAPMRQRSGHDRGAPEQTPTNSDALPHHPVPVRPGHTERGAQPTKPPPVRNYDNGTPSSHKRQASSVESKPPRPVTAPELQQLQAAVNANPHDNKRAMLLVKKFIEASTVLASEGGRADRQTTARNRERFIKEADKLLRKLVSANYADAQFYLADAYGSGALGLDPSPREAFKLYQAAAKVGHGQAAYRTAMCCELGPADGGTTQDYGKAVQWYRRGAALGDVDSMFKIGIILLKGLLGQPRNITEAIAYLRRSVDQSSKEPNPQALYELAQLYESSQRNPEVRSQVAPDDAKAYDLFHQAASAGHKASQFRLGQAYEYGQLGTTIDNRASITWYTKAAAQGDHQAELALSGWYLTGADGILQQSDTEAYLWARKAAASEPPLGKAMFAMGYFTETGIGCPKNMDEAKKWYARAAAYKFPKAQERLEDLRRNGSKNSRPVNGRLSRRDQKKDEENCTVM